MRVLSRILLALVVAAFATAANADIVIDGQTLFKEDISSYRIDVNDGNYTIVVTTTEGWTLEPSNVVPDPDPITLSLSASPTSVVEGDTVNFTWTSTNAETCSTSGGNAAWRALGSVSLNDSAIVTMNEVNPSPFSLTCSATGLNPLTRSAIVTVNPLVPDTTGDCPSPEVSSGDIVSWTSYWEGGVFPDNLRNQVDKILARNDYVAIEFNTGNFNGKGFLESILISSGNRNVAVSECPGMFTQVVAPGCFQRQANGDRLFWSTDGSQNCELDNNKTYYVNITYVDVEDSSDSSTFCDRSSCRYSFKAGAVETR